MARMEQEVRRTGASFAYADKEEIAFVQSLGQMGTQAQSAKQKMREYTDALTSLTATYRAMSNEEQSSEFGKAMAASIDQIKVRAAELKDIMSDTNREIQNLASDTSFTDGLNLMTRTIGASASAIVAWTGDSKEMEAVIKDLAKIGTTVAAVDQLTKAFQKQNLVLLKNPYVIAATGVVAIIAALKKLNDALNKETEAEKKNAEETAKIAKKNADRAKQVAESAAKMMTSYQRLSIEWKRLSNDQQRNEWIKNNKTAFEQLGISINSVKDAESAFVRNTATMVKAFQLRAEASAYESMGNEAYMRYIQKKEELRGKAVHAGDEVRGAVTYRADEGLYTYNPNTGGYRYTEKGARAYNTKLVEESGILDLKHEAGKFVKTFVTLNEQANGLLQGVTGKTPTPAPAKVPKVSKSSNGGFNLANPYEMPAAGTLADLEAQAQVVRNSMGGASTNAEYKEMEDHLNTILAQIRELKGEMDIAFEPGSLNDLTQQLQEAQNVLANLAPDTEAWAAALQDVATKTAAVQSLQAKMGTGVQNTTNDAKDMHTAFNAAAAAVATVGGALQQIDDPAAKIAGIVATAIANIALGFSAATVKTGGVAGVFGWIAAATAGLATMVSTITAIKSVTSAGKFAEGGIVPGNNYNDGLVANVSSGELILNRSQQDSIASQLTNNNPMQNLQLSTEISGTNLRIVLNNDNRSKGGSRGYYANIH